MDVLEKNGRALFNPMEVDEKWETLPLFPYLIGTMTKKERGSSSNINSDGEKPKSGITNSFGADASRRNNRIISFRY